MTNVEQEFLRTVASGKWWLNEKWVFGVFPLIAVVIAIGISRHKKFDFEQFLITCVFCWITVVLVGLFLYHTSLTDMARHINGWIDAFRPMGDNSRIVLIKSRLYWCYWILVCGVGVGLAYVIYKDSRQE